MDRRFKLIFGSVAFFVGVLLIVFSLSNFISTLLMLIGVIFILNVLFIKSLQASCCELLDRKSTRLNSSHT